MKILPIFKEFGYTVTDSKGIEKVKQKLLVKKTRLKILTASIKKKDKREAISFYEMVANLEAALNKTSLLHGQINIETINLSRWINYVKILKTADGKNK